MIKQTNDNLSGPKRGETLKDIMEFDNTNWDACEVDISRFKSIVHARNAYGSAVERYNRNSNSNIKVKQKYNKLYLIRIN